MHDAKLVWITPDAEKVIGYCARVSNPANQNNPNVAGLLRYCIKNKHWSIFEMASMCLEIKTTRAISAQLLRHSSMSFQEFSQRYAETTEIDMPLLRTQDTKDRQNSIDDLDMKDKYFYTKKVKEYFDMGLDLYKQMLSKGIARECARAVLPMNSVSTIMISGNMRSWLHYCDLRMGNGTQWEHKQIASKAQRIFREHCPSICEAMWPQESTES